jgi:putative flippase GtrA
LVNVGLVAALDFGALFFFHQIVQLDISTSVVLGFSAAFAANYISSRIWVFRSNESRNTKRASLPKFALLTFANLLIQSVGVTALVAAGLNYLIAKGILVGAMFFVNYTVSKKLIF